jgi:DNA-binding transcriptional regulator YdaS (Cro superfamily)
MISTARCLSAYTFLAYGSGMKKAGRTITPEDREAAKTLRRIWDAKRRDLALTQERAADLFGGSQSLISQYLLGRIALGRVACMKFARILRVMPEEIRPDFEYANALPEDMPADVVKMAYKLSALPEIVRRDIDRTIDVYSAASTYPALLERLERSPT